MAQRARTAGLLLVVLLGLAVGLCPTWAGAARRDRAAGAAVPFPSLHWKALLLAGDETIAAFDHAIAALATLFQHHHITVVQHFSANPTKLSATVRLATVAALRAAIPLLQVQPGEGCLLYATSHGPRAGLRRPAMRPAGIGSVPRSCTRWCRPRVGRPRPSWSSPAAIRGCFCATRCVAPTASS